jgi:hypothetical protein
MTNNNSKQWDKMCFHFQAAHTSFPSPRIWLEYASIYLNVHLSEYCSLFLIFRPRTSVSSQPNFMDPVQLLFSLPFNACSSVPCPRPAYVTSFSISISQQAPSAQVRWLSENPVSLLLCFGSGYYPNPGPITSVLCQGLPIFQNLLEDWSRHFSP